MKVICPGCKNEVEVKFSDLVLTSFESGGNDTASATVDWQCPECYASCHAHLYGNTFKL